MKMEAECVSHLADLIAAANEIGPVKQFALVWKRGDWPAIAFMGSDLEICTADGESFETWELGNMTGGDLSREEAIELITQ